MNKFKLDTLVKYKGLIYAVSEMDKQGIFLSNKSFFVYIEESSEDFKNIKPFVFYDYSNLSPDIQKFIDYLDSVWTDIYYHLFPTHKSDELFDWEISGKTITITDSFYDFDDDQCVEFVVTFGDSIMVQVSSLDTHTFGSVDGLIEWFKQGRW